MTALLDLKLEPAGEPPQPGGRFAATVLAAGSSRRMGGRHKLLLDVLGRPTIRPIVAQFLRRLCGKPA